MNTKLHETRWVYTDPHFGHNRLMVLARPNFNSIEEMHETMIKEYNSKVQDGDVVLWLGDIGFKADICTILPKLKGYKILILGNHDNYAKSFYRAYFDEVYDKPLYYNSRLVFSHVPLMVSPGTLNVHGHTHNICLKSEQHYNICPEIVGYKPINIKKLVMMLGKIPKENIHFLQEWYAEIQIPNETYEAADLVMSADGTIDAKKSMERIYLKRAYMAKGMTEVEALAKLSES